MATGGLKFTPSKTIKAFMRSEAKMRAVKGPVGSGKTSGCIIELLRQSILMPPGKDGLRRSKMLVVRNTKQQLKDTTLASALEILPIEICKWRESDNILRFEFNDVRCDWLFRSLDTPEDVQRVLSLQVTWTWVEEAREIPVPLLSDLEGRTGRYPSQGVSDDYPEGFRYRSGIIYSTNPPEIDSPHYKLLEKLPQEEENENSIIDVDVFHQPSGLSAEAENIENLRPGYYDELAKGKTQAWIDVYVHGLYAQSQSGKPVYYQSFKFARHISPGALPIDARLPVVIGMDCARTPAAVFKQMRPDGRIFTLREAYGFDMGAETFIRQKLMPIIRNYFPVNPLIFVGDPSWVRQNETNDNSWYKELKKTFTREEGHTVRPGITNDPIARINATDAVLRSYPDGEPLALFDPACKWLLEGLRSKYRYARLKGAGDKLHDRPEKNNWSHIAEANQYADMFLTGSQYHAADYIRVTFNPLNTQTSYRPACGTTGY